MTRKPERPIGPMWLRVLAASGLGLVLTCWMWAIVFKRYPASGGGDGPFFFRLLEAGKVSISRWHELPLWNPYECGGVPLWDNPQSIVASPLVLLMQPFSTTATIGAWVILHVTAGFCGMWLLARDELHTSRIGAFAAACLFAFSVSHSNHFAGGHTAFVTFQLAPLALLLWRRAERDLRAAIGLGLLYALMLYEGGVYAPAFIGLMLALETLTRLESLSRALSIVRAGVVFAVVTGAVSAARLLPVLDQIAHYKRPLGAEQEMVDWQMLKDMYLDRFHALRTPGHEYVWGEFVTYIGPFVLVIALLGLAVSVRQKAWFAFVAVGLFVLMLGHFSRFAPWTLLKTYVPPFISMRVPLRFRLLFILFVAGWVAMAIDRVPLAIERRLGGVTVVRAVRALVVCLALFGTGDIAGHAIDVINAQWDGPPPRSPEPSPRLYLGGPGIGQFIDQPRQNRGRLECWEEWAPYAGAPLWVGDLPQARVAPSEAERADVLAVHRSQNAFVVDVDAREPARVQLNTSWARGWRATAGEVLEEDKQLVVRVPAGRHHVRVWYWPIGLSAGLVVTGVSLVLSIGAIVWLGRRRHGSHRQ